MTLRKLTLFKRFDGHQNKFVEDLVCEPESFPLRVRIKARLVDWYRFRRVKADLEDYQS